tara:strand:+ start:46 stop:276 length:231 start_codon:yes stop_codon:yes gene_type:complete
MKKKWTDERVEKLKQLKQKGKTSYEIAAIFGDVSRSAVMGKLHRLGLCETTKKSTRPITMPTYSFNKKQSTSIDEA